MCANRKWFNNYKEFNSRVVLMENNASYKTIGVGNVKLRMFDGGVQTLINIRHVPDLKKNFIFLDAAVCKFIG